MAAAGFLNLGVLQCGGQAIVLGEKDLKGDLLKHQFGALAALFHGFHNPTVYYTQAR